MATDYSSRASMDNAWQQHGPDSGKPRRERKKNTLEESQRKTAGPGAVQFYAQKNPSIVAEDTYKNVDFVNDGDGGFRETTSIYETLEYGEERIGRVTGKLADGNTTWITSVFHLPYSMCEEIPNFYPRRDDDGHLVLDEDGNPIGGRSRWVIKEGMEDDARRYFQDTLEFFGTHVVPGGMDAVHGGSINLDESRPHMQIISDPLEENTRSKEDGALKNGFSLALGSHRKSARIPWIDLKTGKQLVDAKGQPKTRRENASDKAERHHKQFKKYMLDRGFEIEAERDPVRHGRRSDLHDYQDNRDREALADAAFDTATGLAAEADVESQLAARQTEEAEIAWAEAAELAETWERDELPVLAAEATEAGHQSGRADWLSRVKSGYGQGFAAGKRRAKERYEDTLQEARDYRDRKKTVYETERVKGRAKGLADAKVEFEQDEAPVLRQKAREDTERAVRAEMQPDVNAAAQDRAEAATALAQAQARQQALDRRKAKLNKDRRDIKALKEDLTAASNLLFTQLDDLSAVVGGAQRTYKTLYDMGLALPTAERQEFYKATTNRFKRTSAALEEHDVAGIKLADQIGTVQRRLNARLVAEDDLGDDTAEQKEKDKEGGGSGSGGDPQPND